MQHETGFLREMSDQPENCLSWPGGRKGERLCLLIPPRLAVVLFRSCPPFFFLAMFNPPLPPYPASNIYVDESLEGTVPESAPTGTQSAPYSSLQAAVLAHGLESIPTFLVKKAKPAPGEETVSGTFDPITGAGAKKAKKAWDTEVKRKEKEEATRAKREKEDEEKRVRQAKQREEASKIVLSEPEGADKATRVRPCSLPRWIRCSSLTTRFGLRSCSPSPPLLRPRSSTTSLRSSGISGSGFSDGSTVFESARTTSLWTSVTARATFRSSSPVLL
jgi:hypothetical protein